MVVSLTAHAICQSDQKEVDADCGPRALAVVLSSLNVNYEYADLRRRFGEFDANGVSLATIDDVAKSYGVHTLLAKSSLKGLAERKKHQSFACICWLVENHFVVCADYNSENVVIVDPPEILTFPPATFAARWRGECLLISKNELIPEGAMPGNYWTLLLAGLGLVIAVGITGSALFLVRSRMAILLLCSSYLISCGAECYGQQNQAESHQNAEVRFSTPPRNAIDVGNAQIGTPFPVTLVLQNDTQSIWKLNGVRISCSCVDVDAPKRDIQPGDSLPILIQLSTNQGGERKAVVSFLFGEGPNERALQIPLTWKVTHALFTEPELLSFGEIGLTGKHELTFKVKRFVENGVAVDAKLVDVVTSSKLLSCSHDGCTVKLAITDCGRDPAESAYIYVRDDMMKPGQLIAFPVHWQRPPPDFISLPKEITLGSDLPKDVKVIIYAPRSNLASIEGVEITGDDLSISSWVEKRLSENRIALTITFKLPEGEAKDRSFSIAITFADSRVFHLFGSQAIK